MFGCPVLVSSYSQTRQDHGIAVRQRRILPPSLACLNLSLTLGSPNQTPKSPHPTSRNSVQFHPSPSAAQWPLVQCTMTAEFWLTSYPASGLGPKISVQLRRLLCFPSNLSAMRRRKIHSPSTTHVRATFRILRELRQLQHRPICTAQSLIGIQQSSI